MGVEVRGGKKYFYRSLRVNGRVVKKYLGSGPEGEAAAKRDADEKQKAAEEAAKRKAAFRAEREFHRRIGVMLDALRIACECAVAAEMIAAGYHKPNRGPWRKRREPKAPQPSAPPP